MHTLHLPKHSISHLHQNLCTKQHKDAQFTKNRTPSMTSGCIRQHGLSTEGGSNTDTPYHIPLTPDNIDLSTEGEDNADTPHPPPACPSVSGQGHLFVSGQGHPACCVRTTRTTICIRKTTPICVRTTWT